MDRADFETTPLEVDRQQCYLPLTRQQIFLNNSLETHF